METKKARTLENSSLSVFLRMLLENVVVEVGGVEPPSVSPLLLLLHV